MSYLLTVCLLWTGFGVSFGGGSFPSSASGATPGPTSGAAADSAAGSVEKVVLEENVTDPMELQVAADGRVFFAERGGAIRVWNPETDETRTAGYVPVTTDVEDGLLGMALDPKFASNGWIYAYYSPSSGEPQHLSRFTVEDGRIDPRSEEIVLRVPTQRTECCHSGGSVQFGPDGNLFLSTGDNTNPFRSSGYAPIDERPGQAAFDAQRSSANMDDLRGKILRITPRADGTYGIPEGNLFPRDGSEGRPEIYVMGNRNPFRISIDPRNGWLYWGEVGPDAGAPDPERGPAGHDELNQAREPGFYGWPYFIADNKAYHKYDFAAEEAGPAFDPDDPVNRSVNNTGARDLPAPKEPLIWYPYGPSEEFPELEAGARCAMAGPVYYYDADTVHPRGLPSRFDGVVFFYEWSRNWIKAIHLDENGELAEIEPFGDSVSLTRPQDMELGPGGRLYVIEWGSNFGGENRDAKIVRLDVHGSSARPPSARISASNASGPLPLTPALDASGTEPGTAGGPLTYRWDWTGDGEVDAEGVRVEPTFETPGSREVRLTVEDEEGRTSEATVTVVAGNTEPAVRIATPPNGGVYTPGASVPYRVEVTDAQEATIDPARLRVQPKLIYDSHARYLSPLSVAADSFTVPAEGILVEEEPVLFDRKAELEVSYRDGGADGAPALTGTDRVILQPRVKEAEHWSTAQAVERVGLGDGRAALTLESGAYVGFEPVDLHGIEAIALRLASGAGGRVELRRGGPEGVLLGRLSLPPHRATGGDSRDDPESGGEEQGPGDDGPGREYGSWRTIAVPVTDPGGAGSLYVVARGPTGEVLARFDHLRFVGPGVSAPTDR